MNKEEEDEEEKKVLGITAQSFKEWAGFFSGSWGGSSVLPS